MANPDLRAGKRQRLIRLTKAQIAGRRGPVRQIRYRDEVVSPLALELGCRTLLSRAQRAIATIVSSRVYAGDLRAAVEEPVLRWHEWHIAVALRDITELLLELASGYGGAAGPMTTTILLSQNRAISLARDATTARVLSLEILAAQAAAAAQALRETLQQATLAAETLALPESP